MKIRKTSSILSRNRFILGWVLVLSITSTFLFAKSHYMFTHPKEGHLVYITGNGELGYKYYANEGESQEINRIPDFSFCGYEKGGVSLPHVGEQIRISPKVGDNLDHVQSAINNLSSYPIGPDGYRGAIVLEAGQYHVNGTIIINASGIVLRGEGQDETGTCLIATGRYDHDFMKFSGKKANPYEIEASIRNITDQYVP
ncbi:hypothetical protein GF325_01480, partial [Candidatus Bathyarchaeota archaeon]|nr:hypothetical protein [Candidatus Bathyarchaeota archaeon]